MVKQNTQTPDD